MNEQRNRRKLLGKVASMVIGYLVASAAAVAIFQALQPPQLLTEDRTTMWRLNPGYVGPSATDGEDTGLATIDERGLRSIPGTDPEAAKRILAIGDSFTFGWGVDDAETWPAQLQERLDNAVPERYQVINAGFPGCTSYQALRAFDVWLDDHEPDAVVLLLGRNDARKAFLTDRAAHRLLSWKPPAANYVLPLTLLNYQALQRWHKWRATTPVERVGAEAFEHNIRQLVERALRREIEVIVLQHWPRGKRPTEAIARDLRVPWIDSPMLLRRAAKAQGERLFIPAHHHPNASGYSVLAAKVSEIVLQGSESS